MDLAQESLNPEEGPQTEADYVPDTLRSPVMPDLEAVLVQEYVGQKVVVQLHGTTWRGTLQRVLSHNGQLTLDIGKALLPWAQCKSIKIKEEKPTPASPN